MTTFSSSDRTLLLRRRIMRRVYGYWFIRHAAPTLVLQMLALILLAVGIHEFVSVKFVAANAIATMTSLSAFANFIGSAIANTGFIPQLLFGASGALLLLMGRDLSRIMRSAGGVSRVAAARLLS